MVRRLTFFISQKKINYTVKEFPFPSLGIFISFKCAECSGSRLELGNKRFPVWVWLLAICRGERSVLIALLLSKCEADGSDSEELIGYSPPFPALL